MAHSDIGGHVYQTVASGTHKRWASLKMPRIHLRLLSSKFVLTPKYGSGPFTAITSTDLRLPQLTRNFRLSVYVRGDESSTTLAENLHNRGSCSPKSKLDESIAQEKEKQTRAPWHRDGSELPPVARQRSAGAMTKGRSLVKTRSRSSRVTLA